MSIFIIGNLVLHNDSAARINYIVFVSIQLEYRRKILCYSVTILKVVMIIRTYDCLSKMISKLIFSKFSIILIEDLYLFVS